LKQRIRTSFFQALQGATEAGNMGIADDMPWRDRNDDFDSSRRLRPSALAGQVMNNLKLSSLPSFTLFERGTTSPSSDNGDQQSRQATERARPETAGSRQ
jgi:hypothetical protein